MRIGIIGRTHMLLETAKLLDQNGFILTFIVTSKSESHYEANEADFREFAKSKKIPYYNTPDLESIYSKMANTKTDVVISINWINLIKPNILKLFKYGILNAHAGDLPRYKGNACPNWAILNFEKTVGLSIHKMNEDLDDGPVLVKELMPINEETYVSDIYKWLSERIPLIYLEILKNNSLENFLEVDSNIQTLRTFPRKHIDSKINWEKSTKDILALIRASSYPFDGAYSFLDSNSKKVRIFRASEKDVDFEFMAIPGQVCYLDEDKPIIATKDGLIRLDECYIENLSVKDSAKMICQSLRNRLM